MYDSGPDEAQLPVKLVARYNSTTSKERFGPASKEPRKGDLARYGSLKPRIGGSMHPRWREKKEPKAGNHACDRQRGAAWLAQQHRSERDMQR